MGVEQLEQGIWLEAALRGAAERFDTENTEDGAQSAQRKPCASLISFDAPGQGRV